MKPQAGTMEISLTKKETRLFILRNDMVYSRKHFIRTAAAGLVFTAVGTKLLGCKTSAAATGNLNEFGLQLYTLRDVLPGDPKGVLKQVAAMGYGQIESYEGDQGMF